MASTPIQLKNEGVLEVISQEIMPKLRNKNDLYLSVRKRLGQLENKLYDKSFNYETVSVNSSGMDRVLNIIQHDLDKKWIWMNTNLVNGIENKVKLS